MFNCGKLIQILLLLLKQTVQTLNVIEAAPKFWSLVEGAHSDQIYIHVGHTIEKKFNLAGEDK